MPKPDQFSSIAGRGIIATSNGALSLSLCGLRMRKPEDTASLCRLVANAASTATGKGLSTGGEIRIACGNGAFLHHCVTPLPQQYLVSGSVIPSACARFSLYNQAMCSHIGAGS